jgi:hypothetical protein
MLVVEEARFGVPGRTVEVPRSPLEPDPHPGARERSPAHHMIETTVERSRNAYTFTRAVDVRRWYEGCLEVEKRLDGFGSLLASDPSLQFCLQSARRSLGDLETPCQWYSRFAAEQPDGPWRQAALAELWLRRRVGPPPKPALQCRYTETRPHLDGKLDDPCWQQTRPVRLQEAVGKTVGEYHTEVRLAYDHEFLYLAVRCKHPAGKQVEKVKHRLRDADLHRHDRISLMLDLDRDYCTCFHLQVDQRGCVCEDCWGDRTWDPHWFVATSQEATAWQVEAAIPLQALTGDIPTPGKAWACNVVRTVPGLGVQAWSLPAEAPEVALRPEGMGLLLFHRDDLRPKQQALAAPR